MTATTRPRRNHPVVALRLDGAALRAPDQTRLPFEELELELSSAADVAEAIKRLSIRVAPLSGVAAGHGLARGRQRHPSDASRQSASTPLREARPSAVNLARAVDRVADVARSVPAADRAAVALAEARGIEAEEEAA